MGIFSRNAFIRRTIAKQVEHKRLRDANYRIGKRRAKRKRFEDSLRSARQQGYRSGSKRRKKWF